MKSLKEKLIAVAGVSNDTAKFGYKIFKSLVENGFDVCGINPKGGSILNRPIYKGLSEIGKVPDIVITAVRPEVTENIVEECKRIGIKEIWMQPGSESLTAIENARKYGMSVTHDSCIMIDSGLW